MQEKRPIASPIACRSFADRNRKRLAYVTGKLSLTTYRAIGAIAAVVSAVTVLAILAYAPPGWDHDAGHIALLVLLCMACAHGKGLYSSSDIEMRTLAYVPPVRTQIAALPPHEVLLRGSVVPDATSAELLRAAVLKSHSHPDELLRPDDDPLVD